MIRETGLLSSEMGDKSPMTDALFPPLTSRLASIDSGIQYYYPSFRQYRSVLGLKSITGEFSVQ